MFNTVKNYFRVQGWPINQHPEKPILRIEYEGDHGRWFCYARINERSNQFIFLSIASVKVPEDRRKEMAEYLTRANFGLNIGNFEMDFDDGEVRYKTSIDYTYQSLTSELIDPLIKANFVAMNDYLLGIESVIAGDTTAQEAIEETMRRIKEEEDGYDLIL